jgi:stearoyl-CoA desaturase (delta-9 desaturase)
MVTHRSHFFQLQIPQLLLGFTAIGHLFYYHEWAWLTATFVFWFLAYVMGEGIFLHRHFSHKAFECKPVLGKIFSVFALLGGFGGPISYRATHIGMHHAFSDVPGKDSHSPRDGFLWACFGWYTKVHKLPIIICKSLLAQPYYVWLEKNTIRIWWTTLVVFALIDTRLALYTLGLGGLICFSFAAITNAFAHTYGTRRFDTDDNSRNIAFLSWITWQGSSVLQNNHHAHPGRFHDSWAWYELDVGKWIIPLIATKINR